MSDRKKTFWSENLPDPLPANPLEVAARWLAQACADANQPNPNAMVLASVDGSGQPSARVVLCKEIVPDPGYLVFHTNYLSRKGTELSGNPRAAVVFHWDHVHRQVRIEGRVEALPASESDAYFRSRAWQSRLGAWASQQSQPLASHEALKAAVVAQAKRFGIDYAGPGAPEPEKVVADIPRPPHWGGYRLRAYAVELWVEGAFRIHDRARWTRGHAEDAWSATRLQP
jgi:pyridoxamine 5'-phosphate oxidase